MSTRIDVLFYSMYGHIWQLAEAIAEGVSAVEGAEARLLQVPELVPDDVLAESGAAAARQQFAHVPVAEVDHLVDADAIVVGTPTRYGGMCSQMRSFWDQTGALWMSGKLIGKVGGAFTSTATQHGGQETTIRDVHTMLLHHGLVIAGIPYSAEGLTQLDTIGGGSPYGASTIAGGSGQRQPSAVELELARFQGRHAATLARALARGRAVPDR